MIAILVCFSLFGSLRYRNEEEKPMGTYVGQIPSNSAPDATVTYSLMEKSPSFPFVIGLNDGKIFTAKKLNYEVLCSLQDVQCVLKSHVLIKSNNISNITPVEFIIEDIDEYVPEFGKKELELKVPKCSPLGSRFDLPLAVDLDASLKNRLVEYKFVTNERLSPFKLEKVKTRRQISRISLHLIRPLKAVNKLFGLLSAFNEGSPAKQGVLKIKITIFDCESNKPFFEESEKSVHIFENLTVGSEMTRFHVLAVNPGISYKENFLKNTHGAREHFGIDKTRGIVFLKKKVDYESVRFYKFHVVAYENSNKFIFSEAVLNVFVENCNDNSPVIEVHGKDGGDHLRCGENAQVGTILAKITATDLDEEDQLRLTCEYWGSDLLSLTKIEDRVGEYYLVTQNWLDYEKNQILFLTISCSDNNSGGPRKTTKNVSLLIIDENDNPPKFEKEVYMAEIYENSPPNTFVLSVKATDADSGLNGKVIYKIYSQIFRISENGDIYSVLPLDYEKQQEVDFVVFAVDHGSEPLFDSAFVKIKILDVNDNEPVFPFAENHFYLTENSPVGTLVGNVVAFDVDSCDSLHYEVLPSAVPFRIDSKTGFIYSTEVLDSEKKSKYVFRVIVSDCGPNVLTAKTTVVVHVEDVDDNPTVLSVYDANDNIIDDFSVVNTCLHSANIARASLEDADISQKMDPSFELSSSLAVFTIDRSSGIISIKNLRPELNNSVTHVTILAKNDKIVFEKSLRILVVVNRTCYHNMDPSQEIKRAFPQIFGVVGVICCGVFIWLVIAMNKRRYTLKLFSKPVHSNIHQVASEFTPFYWSDQRPRAESYNCLQEKTERADSTYSLVDNIKLRAKCKECDLIRLNSNYVFISCSCSHNK